MRIGLLPSLMSVVAATGCIPRGPGVMAAQSASAPEGPYAVELPLERTRWVVVEARVAGRPARLMVDTGAANSLLSPALARSLELPQVGTVPVVDFENRRRTMPVVTAPLTLGTAEFRDVGFVVAELGEFAEEACRPIDGLLGQNVLHQTAYEFDVHGGRMWLASDSGQLPAREGGQELRMAPPSYFVQLAAPARGLRPRFMMIDSGSPFALTVEDAVMAALPIGDTVRSSAAMSGLHGGAKVRDETLFLWPDVPVAGLDRDEVLVFHDPPFVGSVRGNRRIYRVEMLGRKEHTEVLSALRSHPGPVAALHYRCDLYDDHLWGWACVETSTVAEHGAKRTLALYLNPTLVRRLSSARRQRALFDENGTP